MKILKQHNIEDIVFIDIETAPADPDFNEESRLYPAWEYDQLKQEINADQITTNYFNKSALYAEYAIIVCISIGLVREGKIVLKSLYGPEKEILEKFHGTLIKAANPKSWLCGHTITGFDIPFLIKRSIINGVPLHNWLDVAHLKPWELPYLDVSVLWRGPAFYRSSLIAMCTALGLPSPKQEISGKDVGRYFYKGKIKKICAYCEQDVIAVINIYRKLTYQPPLEVDILTLSTEIDVITYLLNGGEYTLKIKEDLEKAISRMSQVDRERAFIILNAIPSRAKGKTTLFTKQDVKQLNII